VAHALKKRGYFRVYNLTWGMVGWKVYEWVYQVKERLRQIKIKG
jgi:rhodanese-related sulfurtransferase